jgi:quercetin dioxygenase-like cupin family protein
MSNIDRPLSGKALRFELGGGRHARLIDEESLGRAGRTARTLVKEGALRVTLVALAPGAALAEHHADGPITVHVISGRIRFRVGEDELLLEEGDLLSLAARVPHSAGSDDGGTFLLTVAASSPEAPAAVT